jgi:hypothetical protein
MVAHRAKKTHRQAGRKKLGAKKKVASALVLADAGDFGGAAAAALADVRARLGLSWAHAGAIFGVSGQAVQQWVDRGVPLERVAAVDRVAELVAELGKRFKAPRLPAVVRAPLPILDGRTILETLASEGVAPVYEMFRRWASYVPGVAPIRAGDFAGAK